MTRHKCAKRGHLWVLRFDGFYPAVQSCDRWFCGVERFAWFLPTAAPTRFWPADDPYKLGR